MKKHLPKISVILLAIILAACSKPNAERQSPPENASTEEQLDYIAKKENFSSEKERLQALLELYADNELKHLPPMGTFMGNHTYDHLWMDVSPEGVEKQGIRF